MRSFYTSALPSVFSIGLTVLAALPALAQGSITVTGEASIAASPDMATISLGVTTEGATAAEAMTANSAALTGVLARLQAAGIAETDLQTTSLSLNPNWVGYEAGQSPRIANYVAMNMLNVRVRDLATLGGVLDASIADGANTLNGVSFDLANPRPVQDEARRAAMADAMAKAELYANAAGISLGKITAINEQQNYGGPMPMFMDAKAASPVPVAAGQVALQSQVTVTYAIAE
ncbi:SIMPL domain-containing protein [Tabrizicola sp.]|uniref:SIMPL domain-containing protein n=1 Tax=Tabrizicola sp. TaxID=2005166 RepID=UPI003D268F42